MSKYHKLTNTDCNNDGSTTTTTTTATLTDDDENFGIFYRNDNTSNGDHHQLRNINNNDNTQSQQHHNYYYDNDDDEHDNYRSNKHRHLESLSNGTHVEDLIHYNNNDTNINFAKRSVNNNTTGKVVIMNNSNSHHRNKYNNVLNCSGNIKSTTSTNNLMTASDTADADDSTMEIPLLHHDHQHQHHHNNNNSNSNNYNNKHHHFEYVCMCQQKGFASNLNSNSTKTAKSKILWAIVLCCVFMIVEFLGGYIAGSLAIMTDAAHLASDCISFVIGLVAIWLGNRPPDAKMSFGYKRLEVLGAIISILGIWILTATLVLVAIQRIYSNDYDLDANTMMAISSIGILINIIMIFILHTSLFDLPAGSIGSSHGHSHNHTHNHHGHSHSHSHSTPSVHRRRHSHESSHLHSTRSLDTDATGAAAIVDTGEATSIELSSAPLVLNGNSVKHQQDGNEKNLNLRAAMIHVIGDLVQSFGVFIASVLIKIFPKAVFLDPLCTLLFSVIVVMTTVNLFKESMHLIMDTVPQGISIDNLEMDLLDIEGVKSVHHLNVWNHTSNHAILMVHLVIDILADSNTVLMKATQLAESDKYEIKHSTIQIERVTS